MNIQFITCVVLWSSAQVLVRADSGRRELRSFANIASADGSNKTSPDALTDNLFAADPEFEVLTNSDIATLLYRRASFSSSSFSSPRRRASFSYRSPPRRSLSFSTPRRRSSAIGFSTPRRRATALGFSTPRRRLYSASAGASHSTWSSPRRRAPLSSWSSPRRRAPLSSWSSPRRRGSGWPSPPRRRALSPPSRRRAPPINWSSPRRRTPLSSWSSPPRRRLASTQTGAGYNSPRRRMPSPSSPPHAFDSGLQKKHHPAQAGYSSPRRRRSVSTVYTPPALPPRRRLSPPRRRTTSSSSTSPRRRLSVQSGVGSSPVSSPHELDSGLHKKQHHHMQTGNGGYANGGYNGGYNNGGFANGGYNGGYHTGAYANGGYNGGYNTGGYANGGYPIGGYNGGYIGGYHPVGVDDSMRRKGGYHNDGYYPGPAPVIVPIPISSGSSSPGMDQSLHKKGTPTVKPNVVHTTLAPSSKQSAFDIAGMSMLGSVGTDCSLCWEYCMRTLGFSATGDSPVVSPAPSKAEELHFPLPGSAHGTSESPPATENGAGLGMGVGAAASSANIALAPPPPADQTVTPHIPREMAERFIEALRLEYIDHIKGSVGAFFEETFGQESGTVGTSDLGTMLEKEKEKVRDADNRKEAIEALEERLAASSPSVLTIVPACPTIVPSCPTIVPSSAPNLVPSSAPVHTIIPGLSIAPDIAGRFIAALRDEYVDNIVGSMGAFYEESGAPSDVGRMLKQEERAVRDAHDPKAAIEALMSRVDSSGSCVPTKTIV